MNAGDLTTAKPNSGKWIQRTPEEIELWHKNAECDAIAHGRMIAGLVWILVAVVSAGGWFLFLGGNVTLALQHEVQGNFWTRVPAFGIFAAPFAYFVYRHEKRNELGRLKARTVCAACDTSSEGNAGMPCQCGGSFVLSSTMKWVEK